MIKCDRKASETKTTIGKTEKIRKIIEQATSLAADVLNETKIPRRMSAI
jgi:hypothetical protein